MIAFTTDIDWAPDEIIQDTIDLFEKYNVKCTLFCTHDSSVIKKLNRELFEIAIHPNFNKILNGKGDKNAKEVLEEILKIYPESKGVRSHSMTQSSMLLALFKSLGIKYDCNQFFPYNWKIYPYKCWTGLTRIPYNWEDDIHWLYNKRFDFDILKDYNNKSMIVLDFHPIHVFLNTNSKLTYEKAKPFYQNYHKLIGFRNKKEQGVRDFLIKTLEKIEKREIRTYKLIELIN